VTRLGISGTYSSGKTFTAMALSHLTGLPRSHARTMREIMPGILPGRVLEGCTAAELVGLIVTRHTERAVQESALGTSFVSDGSSLQEWVYGTVRVRVGIDPNRSARLGRGEQVALTPELGFYGETLEQLGRSFRRHVAGTFDAFVHLRHELPMTRDGHRPVNDNFRAMADELLIATLAGLHIPTHLIGGTPADRLEQICVATGLPRVMAIDDAVRAAEADYAALDVRLEAVRSHGRTATVAGGFS
jgi:AAA domain